MTEIIFFLKKIEEETNGDLVIVSIYNNIEGGGCS